MFIFYLFRNILNEDMYLHICLYLNVLIFEVGPMYSNRAPLFFSALIIPIGIFKSLF